MLPHGVRDRSRFHVGFALVSLIACVCAILLTCLSTNAHAARPSGLTRSPQYRSSPAPLKGISGRWHWIFDSNFQGHPYSPKQWQPTWFNHGQQITGPISPVESACYSTSNISSSRYGVGLGLTAQPATCSGEREPYTGSILSTNPHDGRPSGGFQFTYGIVQVKMYLPGLKNGQIADWPVAISLAQPGPLYGEDDMMEGLSGQVCSHLHTDYYADGSPLGACDAKLKPGWHVFSTDWQPGSVTWYYDGKKLATYHQGVCTQPMYLVLANTTPAQAPNVDRPDVARVAYVRVWQRIS